MKHHLVYAWLLLTSVALQAQPAAPPLPTPRQLYPGLFEAVQLQRAYPDGKTFVDALPSAGATPAQIVAAYEQQRTKPGFDLKALVNQYFTPHSCHGQRLPQQCAGRHPGAPQYALNGAEPPGPVASGALFVAAAPAQALRGARRPLPRAVLPGLVPHDAAALPPTSPATRWNLFRTPASGAASG